MKTRTGGRAVDKSKEDLAQVEMAQARRTELRYNLIKRHTRSNLTTLYLDMTKIY